MNAITTRSTRASRRLAAIVIVVALALSVAAIATLRAEPNGTDRGIFTTMGDYLTAVGEALGGG